MQSAAASAQGKQSNLIPWKPGQSGNPKGREKGSRNKLSEAFLSDVLSEWKSHGAVAISDMREKNPGDFCKLVASLVPKESTLNLNRNDAEELSDDEIRARLQRLASTVAGLLADGNGEPDQCIEAERVEEQPSQVH